jgi:hypothetical protein
MWSVVEVFPIPPPPNIAILTLSSQARRFAMSDTYPYQKIYPMWKAAKVEKVVDGYNDQHYLQLKPSAILYKHT